MLLLQSAAKTKQDADDTFDDAMDLEEDVTKMMQKLDTAEGELALKKDEADQDMMMADMVSVLTFLTTQCQYCFWLNSTSI